MYKKLKLDSRRRKMLLLKWAAVLLPALVFILIDVVSRLLPFNPERINSDFITVHAINGAAVIIVSYIIFTLISRLQNRITQDNRDSAVIQERERTAREMHDGMAQLLGYINTQTIAVRKLLSDNRFAEAREELTKIENIARGLYADVREGILGLRIPADSRDGLVKTMREYAASYTEMSGIRIEIEALAGIELSDLSPSSEIQLTRIVQEALTNVRKHSKATNAVVTFARCGNELSLTITDNGRGFDMTHLPPREWPRFGLQTMKERAQAVGGGFEIHTAPGKGCSILVRVPFSGEKSRGKI
ncbi:MAG: sensor histidine kinase [Dehalococcoidales bacterium]|nr:sensor histidine kinase [Dehalococcoidales bacterium]